jgi:pyridoxal phosphate enzyme (YggS family)
MENLYNEQFKRVEENYKIITEEINQAAVKSGRNIKDITFLAATKTVPYEIINHSIECGIKCIGENRVQELIGKYDKLNTTDCDVQFIGRLQVNKVKYIIDKVSQIQSVDSEKLAKCISDESVKKNKNTNILIEVNIGNEESKGGIDESSIYEFIDKVKDLKNITICGLMAIPPFSADNKSLHEYFSRMYKYYVDIKSKKIDNTNIICLSMGMSSDYTIAVEEGANMVRIGTALYGRRQ